MKSEIVIGCKECEKELYKRQHFRYGGRHGIQLSFPVFTVYSADDLPDLSLGFTCDFCENDLEMTAKMLKFIATFFDKSFHIHMLSEAIHISNGEISFSIPIGRKVESIEEYLLNLGLKTQNDKDYLPTKEDIELIQAAANDFDSNKWYFSLKSGHVPALLSNKNPSPYDPMI